MTGWTDDTWEAFCALLEEAWPGEFDDRARTSWRTLLDTVDPAAALASLRRLLLTGQRFRPSVSELLGEARHDPSAPTFDEACRLIFGKGGVLKAKPEFRPVWVGNELAEQTRQARLDRATTLHPLIASFVARQGLDRLAKLPLNDPDWGEKHRRDLQAAWDEHVEVVDGRDVATLATPGRGGLGRLDPLAHLNPPLDPSPGPPRLDPVRA